MADTGVETGAVSFAAPGRRLDLPSLVWAVELLGVLRADALIAVRRP